MGEAQLCLKATLAHVSLNLTHTSQGIYLVLPLLILKLG